tara:strand:+ start:63 stop:491 length:429 start_codon:yes stop_codon:yes gene_type:complete
MSYAHFENLMWWVGGISLFIGSIFFLQGAWPVVGFMGLDVLLIYWAFKSYFRHAKAYEHVQLDNDYLHLEHVDAKGRAQHWQLEPGMMRVLREGEGRKAPLRLYAQGSTVELGRYIADDEKNYICTQLKEALRLRLKALPHQ